MATVVVGQNFHGTLAPAPVDKTPKQQPPQVALDRGADAYAAAAAVRTAGAVQARAADACSSSYSSPTPTTPIRALQRSRRATRPSGSTYRDRRERVLGHPADELERGAGARRRQLRPPIRGREYSLYYSGAHLHMVVLRENGATYWVVNTLLDSLSNETMLAIAEGCSRSPK